MRNIEIKRIKSEQAYQVYELFDAYRVFYKKPSDLALAKLFIDERLSKNESIIFIAFIDEIAVAFTQLYPKYSSGKAEKNWILNDLYVNEKYRKQGIGEALISTAMDFAKDDGAKFVQLETATDNFTAQSLYEQIGFVKQEPDEEFLLYKIEI